MTTATPSTQPLLAFSKCGFSAFFSYAHADNDGWNGWISSFGDEFKLGLSSRLRGVNVPRLHVSGDNGPQSGQLSQALTHNIAQSFAMFLFVHDNYVDSDWCWKELKAFKDTFGDDGFRQRLYVVVMSELAWAAMMREARWTTLFPYNDPSWLRFYRADEIGWPYRIYSENAQDQHRKAQVSPAFWEPFVKVREQLVAKVKESLATEQQIRSYPELTPAPAAAAEPEPSEVLVFIESPKDLVQRSLAIGNEVSAQWRDIVEPMALRPPLLLRPTGLPMEDLRLRPRLANADGVILLWASKTPDTLAVEIQKLEPSLEGPDVAPGLIAYPVNDSDEAGIQRKINGWAVVRFRYDSDGQARPLDDDDAQRLENFLNRVLRRKRKRLALSSAQNLT